jgi:hypothetical protein
MEQHGKRNEQSQSKDLKEQKADVVITFTLSVVLVCIEKPCEADNME